VGVIRNLGSGRTHGAEAAEEEVGDDRGQVGMAERAFRLQPGEHPVHHAEEQHGERLLQAPRGKLGTDRDDRVGEGSDDAALAVEHPLLLGCSEEANVVGEDAVLGLRAGVGGEEGVDEAAQALLRRRLGGVDFGDQRQQPGDVRLGDLGEQLVLVADVVIERGLRDAARLGDFVHRRRRVAALREQLRSAGEDRLALQLVAGGASARQAISRRRTGRRAR